jgi:hypothetical protein
MVVPRVQESSLSRHLRMLVMPLRSSMAMTGKAATSRFERIALRVPLPAASEVVEVLAVVVASKAASAAAEALEGVADSEEVSLCVEASKVDMAVVHPQVDLDSMPTPEPPNHQTPSLISRLPAASPARPYMFAT